MPGLYKIVGGSHFDSDANRHRPGDTYSPTDRELAAFPGRFELIEDQENAIGAYLGLSGGDLQEEVKDIAARIAHLDHVAIFIKNTNPGIVLKAIADDRFTAKEALVAEQFGLNRPELVTSLEAVIEGRIEPHPDNVISLDDLANLPAIEDDQGEPESFIVETATIDQVLQAVASGDLAPDVALAQERGREKPRKGLLSKLEAMLE